jgi:hypothetical protein
MARLIYSAITSLDGYVADEDGKKFARTTRSNLSASAPKNG